jgi:hypothetical protein
LISGFSVLFEDMSHSIVAFSELGQKVSPQDYLATLPEFEQAQLKPVIARFERDGELKQGPLVSTDGPGRYQVKIRTEENRFKTCILELADNKQLQDGDFYDPRLVFYPESLERWVTPGALYVGRPGEEEFQPPPEVAQVFEQILSGVATPEALQLPDGSYQIKIERTSYGPIRIYGKAVWKGTAR